MGAGGFWIARFAFGLHDGGDPESRLLARIKARPPRGVRMTGEEDVRCGSG